MDEKGIAIIVHRTDDTALMRLQGSLSGLQVPQGFKLRVTAIGGGTRWQAYNHAMKALDAKYKIYLDEQVEILNKNFLIDTINLFESDASIGVIGVSGALSISTSGLALQSEKRCGKMMLGANQNVVNWGEINAAYQQVDAVDGFMIATQYDIRWRDDLFADNSCCDTAQCLEFKRKGYKSVVIRQDTAWFRRLNASISISESARQNFLKEYSKELYPTVLILMPTFNRPQFATAAIESALNQTYRNLHIVISDDSTNEATYALMQSYIARDDRIHYFRHAGFTGKDNFDFLTNYRTEHPEIEYSNWLLDDDLFYPTKIEKMIEACRNNPDVALVSSLRHNIDVNGNIIGQMEPLHGVTEKLDGKKVGKFLLMYTANRVGEPTTVLVRTSFLKDWKKQYWRNRAGLGDTPYPLGDYSEWLYLLERGNLYWINEFLSARRVHEGQDSQQIDTWVSIYINFAEEVCDAWNHKKFLENEGEVRHAIIVWLVKASSALQKAFFEGYEGRETRMMERTIVAMTEGLYNGGKIKIPKWPDK